MPKKVLVIEDSKINRDLISRYLVKSGMQVSIAENGKEGVTLAESENPDVIIMDLMMPIMGGIEATQILKSKGRTKNIPIIVLTANVSKSSEQKAKEAGCDDFENKPVNLKQLLGKIERYTR